MTENPDPRLAHALDPEAIAACRYCDEFGWLWRGDVIRARCTHRRKVSDLTLDDVLNDTDDQGGAA